MSCGHRDQGDVSIVFRSVPHIAALEIAMYRSHSCFASLCLAAIVLLLTPAKSRAWSAEGHTIVVLVADRLLQAQESPTPRKLAELLASDKSNSWTKTDIAGEATWADALREKSPEGRAATTKWHYVKLDVNNPDLTKACFGNPAPRRRRRRGNGRKDTAVAEKTKSLAKSSAIPPPSRGSG